MAEMVEALDTLNSLNVNCISLFGSARCTPESQEYKDAEKISRLLVEAGFGIISGGGPGIMLATRYGGETHFATPALTDDFAPVERYTLPLLRR